MLCRSTITATITGARIYSLAVCGLGGLAIWLACAAQGFGQTPTTPGTTASPGATPAAAAAPEAATLNTGDNAWVLTSSALVLMMTGPGLAMFYSGLFARKTCWA